MLNLNRLLLTAVCGIFIITTNTLASGTYQAPSVSWYKNRGISEEDVRGGEELVVSKSGQEKSMSCAECHDKDKDVPFKRSKLNKTKENFGPQIQKCMEDPARFNSPKASKDDIRKIGSFLISQYKLKKKIGKEFKKFLEK